MARSLFNYKLDGVTYTRQELEAHRRADARAEQDAQEAMEYAAEQAAELAAERYFEDRGYEAARAQEDYEARMGVFA